MDIYRLADREETGASLRELGRRSKRWAKEYGRFIQRLATMYRTAGRELEGMRLEPETEKQAKQELEWILLRAHHKVSELESLAQSGA